MYDTHGRYTPAPGTEYPFSISDIARAATPLLGDDWTAESGVFGVTGHIEAPAGDLYLLAVGDTGTHAVDLYVEHDGDERPLPSACSVDGLDFLADLVAITIRDMHHSGADEPWTVGQHLTTALAARGHRAVDDPQSAASHFVLAGPDNMTLTITGTARTGDGVEHTPEDHRAWTAVRRVGENEAVIYQTPADSTYRPDFAEDTADLLRTVLPILALAAQ